MTSSVLYPREKNINTIATESLSLATECSNILDFFFIKSRE